MSTNKDHLTLLGQGNPTGPAQAAGAEERKKAFIDEIIEVYKKHGLSIAHDSGAGTFIITDIDDRLVNWMKNAELED